MKGTLEAKKRSYKLLKILLESTFYFWRNLMECGFVGLAFFFGVFLLLVVFFELVLYACMCARSRHMTSNSWHTYLSGDQPWHANKLTNFLGDKSPMPVDAFCTLFDMRIMPGCKFIKDLDDQKSIKNNKWNFLCSSLCPLPLSLSLGTTEKIPDSQAIFY